MVTLYVHSMLLIYANKSLMSDPSSEASSTRDALHPQPGQHRVYIPDGAGGVRGPDPQHRHDDPGDAGPLHLLTMPNRLHTNLEVGQGFQR